jgi:hypothetical protein
MRISLKNLLAVVALVCVACFLLTNLSPVRGLGCVIAALIAWRTLLTPQFRMNFHGAVLLGCLSVFWFLGVDRSYSSRRCDQCSSSQWSRTLQVLGIPIHSTISTEESFSAHIARDLVVRCTHSFDNWLTIEREFGLLIPVAYFTGTYALDLSHEWYEGRASSKIRALGRLDPWTARQFHVRALRGDDSDVMDDFISTSGLTELRRDQALAIADRLAASRGYNVALNPTRKAHYSNGKWHVLYGQFRGPGDHFSISVDDSDGSTEINGGA